jgi:nucleotide-binding universal stress UspA family protein
LERLHVAEEHWPLIDLHQASAYPDTAILAAVAAHGVGLLVMTARGAEFEAPDVSEISTKLFGHVTSAVLERCSVPTLLMPPAYLEELPWRRFLVPIGGQRRCDEALALAARLGRALDVSVHVVHVADPTRSGEPLQHRARYSDAVHHEYPARLEELVDRVLPSVTSEERERIQGTDLHHGTLVDELLALMAPPGSVLVVEWSGQLRPGRAAVLKGLLAGVRGPVLLVRSAAPPQFHLKVGEELG